MITIAFIQAAYDQVLAEVIEILPLHQWKHQPTGLDFTDEKTKLGIATRHGKLLINRAYIGTSATTMLSNTLRHEFAHLAVGLSQHHNWLFKNVERRFGVDKQRDLFEERAQIQAKIDYKYSLLAHLDGGEIRNLGGVHRKTKRYTSYPENGNFTWRIEGIRVLRFEFQENAN